LSEFYEETPEPGFRFGDVITGFQAVVPHLHKPGSGGESVEWGIMVSRPAYFAVITPCCSIEEKSIALTPLSPIRPSFLRNPYFAADLTRINRKVAPENSVAPEQWSRFPAERRQKMITVGEAYALMDVFVYAEHPLLRRYDLPTQHSGMVVTGFYLIDFKSIYRVNCNEIVRGKDAPKGTKLLQLKLTAREELRQKLAYYFARIPEEDQVTPS
jgi:hypothetical protein